MDDIRAQLLTYTEAAPPSNVVFKKISDLLLADLIGSTGLEFRITKRYVEPKSWVTIQLRLETQNKVLDTRFV